MSYESIFDKVNDISIHSNGYSNLYYQGERLDSTEVVYVLNVADIAYAMKHYKNGTIVVCNEKIYTIKDGCAVFIDYNYRHFTDTDTNEEEQPCHEIKKTTCDACGAHLPINNVNNNGVCKCGYCDTFHYVW